MRRSRHWLDVVHPEDVERVTGEAKLLFTDPNYRKELEYRIIRKDGEVRWIHSYDRNYLCNDGRTRMVQGLLLDVTERKNQEIALKGANRRILEQKERLEALATTDALTGLYNRRVVLESMERNIHLFHRTTLPFSVFLFDLDRFKEINDTYGHEAGDHVLVGIAEKLLNCVRRCRIGRRVVDGRISSSLRG